jgi:outer membrane protein assembly factor BamB
MLTVAVTLVALPTANAHTPPWTVPTYAYVAASPNPVGVGQSVFVLMWLDKVPPSAGGIGGDRWQNYTLKITKPNNDTQTLGPFTSDPTSSYFMQYTPDQVGTYTFVFNFPGQVATLKGATGIDPDITLGFFGRLDFINDTFTGSTATTTLTVQQEPVAEPPTYPLPTEYWTRPIEGQNTAWASVASNYLYPFASAWAFGSERLQPDGTAPNSPHIMWTKPIQFGGVVGGSNTSIPGVTFYTGLSYESRFSSPLIMYGRLYYRLPFGNNPTGGGFACVDLRTGEQLWVQNLPALPSFAQLYDYESMNQHGVVPNGYLWATSTVGSGASAYTVWSAYDGLTGNWLFNLTNVPSGTMVYAPDGSINIYQLNTTNATNGWLAMWNSSAAPNGPLVLTPGIGTNSYQYRPIGKNANMSTAYTWNATGLTIPTGSTIIKVIPNDMVLASTPPLNPTFFGLGGGTQVWTVSAISLKPGSRGQLLWSKTYQPPAGNLTRQFGPVDPVTRVFTMNDRETMQWLGYNLDNGDLLWGPVGKTRAFNYYPTIGMGGSGPAGFIAYGKLYVGGYGGEEFCYDVKTGNLLWKYNNTYSAHETPWGNYPIFPAAICDGKIYLYSGEHSPNVPPYKGSRVRCLNATTGEEMWTMLSWGAVGGFADEGFPVADGFLVYLNCYDMQVYCLGKGPSATTVQAPMTAITAGDSVVIQGRVIDISPGTEQPEQAARFPNGVPCVTDDNMGGWMEFVYMQKPCPVNVTGVEVTIDAVDPNNNFINIGTATTDGFGLLSYAWKTPDVPGKYTVIATFQGSESYYASYSETAMIVQEAPAASPTPTPLVLPPYENYTIAAVVILLIAIAIVGILLLRKK